MDPADLTVTLPADIADMVQRKVRSGAYASAHEVIRDGLKALEERDLAIENWLREEVLPGNAEYLKDPTRAVAAGDLLDRIQARRTDRRA